MCQFWLLVRTFQRNQSHLLGVPYCYQARFIYFKEPIRLILDGIYAHMHPTGFFLVGNLQSSNVLIFVSASIFMFLTSHRASDCWDFSTVSGISSKYTDIINAFASFLSLPLTTLVTEYVVILDTFWGVNILSGRPWFSRGGTVPFDLCTFFLHYGFYEFMFPCFFNVIKNSITSSSSDTEQLTSDTSS